MFDFILDSEVFRLSDKKLFSIRDFISLRDFDFIVFKVKIAAIILDK